MIFPVGPWTSGVFSPLDKFVFGWECQHSKSFGGCGENLRFASDCGGFHAAASRDEGTRSAVGVGDILRMQSGLCVTVTAGWTILWLATTNSEASMRNGALRRGCVSAETFGGRE